MKQRKKKIGVTIQDWLVSKPYTQYDRYDMEYLQIAQQVYELLEAIEDVFEGYGLKGQEHRVDLACLITSFFEDFISEIGFWSSLTDFYTERYGAPFLFYDTSDYDRDYLNSADLSFLCWHYFATASNRFIPPDIDLYENLGQTLYELLEPQIEEVPTTDFYEKYLTIDSSASFEEVYEKLRWLVRKSYLWGWCNQVAFERRALALLDEQIAQGKQLTKELMADLENDFQIRLHCFGAVHPAFWLSRVARTTSEMRNHIHNMATIHTGLFQYVESDKERICLEHTTSKVYYWVQKSSLPEPEALETDADVFFCPLMRWKNTWHLAGVISFYEKSGSWVGDFDANYELPFEQVPAEEQKIQKALLPEVGHYFEAHFKSPFVVFRDREAAESKLLDFYRNIKPNPGHADLRPSSTFSEKKPIIMDGVEEEETAVALFFGQDSGIQFFSRPLDWLLVLQQRDSLSAMEKYQTYVDMTMKAGHPELMDYIFGLYGKEVIEKPFGDLSGIKGVEEIEFFRTYYIPETFLPTPYLPLWNRENPAD